MGRKRQRQRQFEQTVAAIQARWGPRAIRPARQKPVAEGEDILSTGFRGVNAILGGGLPRGHIVELVAAGTAGQATLLAQVLGRAQAAGLGVVYLDLEHRVDLDFLARRAVDVQELVILRPVSFAHGLELLDDLVRRGGADLVVLDSLHAMLSTEEAAALDQRLRVWNPCLARNRAMLLVLTDVIDPAWYPPALRALAHFAAVRLLFEHERWTHARRRVNGFVARVTVLKNRGGAPGRAARIAVSFHNHIHGDDA
jgi:hypothetical protein